MVRTISCGINSPPDINGKDKDIQIKAKLAKKSFLTISITRFYKFFNIIFGICSFPSWMDQLSPRIDGGYGVQSRRKRR